MQQSIIAIGNPGAGKSSILNAIAGKILFKSGVSMGKGLTYSLQQMSVGNLRYCDTPGLADVERKKAAGDAIRTSLNMGGPHKIIFFCTQKYVQASPQLFFAVTARITCGICSILIC